MGCSTDGFSGRRSSTGGSSPAATSAANMGASLYLPVAMLAELPSSSGSAAAPAKPNPETPSNSAPHAIPNSLLAFIYLPPVNWLE